MITKAAPLSVGSKARLLLLAFGFLAGLVVLGQRLHRLMVVEHAFYLDRAQQNTVATELIPAPRGRMFDRKGRVLVSNEPRFELRCVVGEVRDLDGCVAAVSKILQRNPEELKEKLLERKRQAPLEALVLERSLTRQQLLQLTTVVERHAGLGVESRSNRRYPYGPLASHVLGTVGEITADELRSRRKLGYRLSDELGKTGLEKSYEELLKGRKGRRTIHIDVAGRALKKTVQQKPQVGSDLHLTLDLKLQLVAENALREKLLELKELNRARSYGSVVALEAKTGRVLAMVSLPQFDPRPFARGILAKEYHQLVSDPTYPLLNRAVAGTLSPGSTYKLVTGSTALAEGLCNTGSHFYCGGSFMGANCFVTSGHGGINFEDSLAHSCDVVYYTLGHRLGIERIHRYASAFSLGQKTGIDLDEESPGLLPDAAWKERVVGEEWYPGDTVNLSIGQGFLLVTPLQMAVVTAAVANGGTVVRPYLLERATNFKGVNSFTADRKPVRKLPVKPEMLASVRRGMRGAVLYGTSTACNSELASVAGKTGTVENSPSTYNPYGKNHTWFVSFSPYEDPELVVVCALEASGGYGGGNAAPVVRKVIDAYFADSTGRTKR